MSEYSSSLFVSFPTASDELLHWWHVQDGELIAEGCDADPLLAAQLKLLPDDVGSLQCIGLVRSDMVVVRWHSPEEDANDKQNIAAAGLKARSKSLAPEIMHIAAAIEVAGDIVTAAIGQDVLGAGLVILQERGLDPDIVMPSGLIVEQTGEQIVSADFGFDSLLRGPKFVAPDEPSFRSQIAAPSEVAEMAGVQLDQLIACAPEAALSLNLRSGPFAKRKKNRIDRSQKRLLGGMFVALIIISLAIPVVQFSRYEMAIDDANEKALALAAPAVGDAETPEAAEKRLDALLISQNRGNIIFSVPASAIFSAVQQVPGVSVGRLSYQRNGIVAAELSAVRNEDINPVLLAIQQAGFVITATPRSDATGTAKADITVRAP